MRIGDIPANDSAIPKNGTEVLAATGINQAEAQQAGSFNPGVLNRAQGAAEAVADKVKAGNFDIADIPQAAADIQGLATLIGGIYTPGQDSSRDLELCGASPYAMDLMAYAPKYKFLFVMEFEFTDSFAADFGFNAKQASFVVKSSTRPHVNFEHEEVNMYNYWVRVPKRTSYEPMTLRFYDDNQNAAMGLYETYLKAVSPIANLAFPQKMEAGDNVFGEQSMSFGNVDDSGTVISQFVTPYAGSFGTIGNGDEVNVFRRITMYQIYGYGAQVNMYKFFNPKVLSMELDDMDMAESGSGNEVSMQFAYDAVHIATNIPLGSSPKEAAKIKELSQIKDYAIDPLFKGDVEAMTKSDNGREPGDPDKGGGLLSDIGASISSFGDDAVNFGSGIVDSASEITSNAFTSVSDFTGSVFSTGAASGDVNSIAGSVTPDI